METMCLNLDWPVLLKTCHSIKEWWCIQCQTIHWYMYVCVVAKCSFIVPMQYRFVQWHFSLAFSFPSFSLALVFYDVLMY